LPVEFIRRVLKDFNAGELDGASAAAQLGVSRTRLYELRADYLRRKSSYAGKSSGGDRSGGWPPEATAFLQEFLPLLNPPNYQLVADELQRLCGWRRSRSTVEAHVKKHFGHLAPASIRKARTYRRFRRAHIGELWQHDSSIHQWWPAPAKQVLLLTVDDHSGMNLAGRFVEADTTWNHFCHFRQAFQSWGLPEVIYTDGLSLFGPSATHDHSDPKSEFQRALKGLGVAHLVAPTPQAKGKIERRFGTFQKRMVTLLAYAKAHTWRQADEILQMELARQNRTRNRSIDKIPIESWEDQILNATARIRQCLAPALLDLHFSLRCSRRVNVDQTIDFEGQNYEIAATQRKTVTIVHHPRRHFWVVEHSPGAVWPPILGHFSL
jgi:hypothetical protein